MNVFRFFKTSVVAAVLCVSASMLADGVLTVKVGDQEFRIGDYMLQELGVLKDLSEDVRGDEAVPIEGGVTPTVFTTIASAMGKIWNLREADPDEQITESRQILKARCPTIPKALAVLRALDFFDLTPSSRFGMAFVLHYADVDKDYAANAHHPYDELPESVRNRIGREEYIMLSQMLTGAIASNIRLNNEHIPLKFPAVIRAVLARKFSVPAGRVRDHWYSSVLRGLGGDLRGISLVPEIEQVSNLNLADAGISVLPPEIGSLTKLRELLLDGNHLETLPASIGLLVNVETLILSTNQLKFLPESIVNLSSLQHLFLTNNSLEGLPVGIRNWQDLRNLHLAGNRLKSLPNGITELRNLAMLNVSRNELSTLPAGIVEMGNLSQLSVGKNYLSRSERTRLADVFGPLVHGVNDQRRRLSWR